jgi:bacterioferritin-associated ferredoxin
VDPDQEICLCFHVTRRKIENFLRIEKPRKAGQLAECFGAGTGCGWCRRYLVALFESQRDQTQGQASIDIPAADEYARLRASYRRDCRSGGDSAPAPETASDEP